MEEINFQLKVNMSELQYNFRTMEKWAVYFLFPKMMLTIVLIYGNHKHLRMTKIQLIDIHMSQVLIFNYFLHFCGRGPGRTLLFQLLKNPEFRKLRVAHFRELPLFFFSPITLNFSSDPNRVFSVSVLK